MSFEVLGSPTPEPEKKRTEAPTSGTTKSAADQAKAMTQDLRVTPVS